MQLRLRLVTPARKNESSENRELSAVAAHHAIVIKSALKLG